MGKARHEADRNWVSADHYNRDRAGCPFGSEARRGSPGYDDVGPQAKQLGGEIGIALRTALCEAVFHMQRAVRSAIPISSMGSPPGTRCPSLPQAQDAAIAPASPWGRAESF